jgi:hypothetical protein
MAEALLEALRMTNASGQPLVEMISAGLSRGRTEGMEQGLRAAKREDPVKLLRRFGRLSPPRTPRIEPVVHPARLSTLLGAALDAGTFAEFEQGLGGGSDA